MRSLICRVYILCATTATINGAYHHVASCLPISSDRATLGVLRPMKQSARRVFKNRASSERFGGTTRGLWTNTTSSFPKSRKTASRRLPRRMGEVSSTWRDQMIFRSLSEVSRSYMTTSGPSFGVFPCGCMSYHPALLQLYASSDVTLTSSGRFLYLRKMLIAFLLSPSMEALAHLVDSNFCVFKRKKEKKLRCMTRVCPCESGHMG